MNHRFGVATWERTSTFVKTGDLTVQAGCQSDDALSPPRLDKVLRVLIVEDEEVLGVLLAELLVAIGYDVCGIEATEADAIAAAARCEPDLMIVDVQLGTGSGSSAMAQIRQTVRIPHVFISGNPVQGLALEPGAVVLQKPFLESALVLAIQRALAASPAA